MSKSIDWDDAVKMLKAYQNNPDALKADPPNGKEILKGFTVSGADVQGILDNPLVEDVFVMPAVNLSDIAKPVADQSFTVVLAGLNKDGNIVENSAVDFCIPCPKYCADNYPKK